ncbi:hypothetical protein BCR36DRAFT_412750 [Piromyces finnis]|uniref:Amino acid transporter transmembrane domain-containing protein n=1 Tax=Piromyces finnis TaxID=1754191 RepID=A0A1Y1V7R3_9FUNG|nr:hypothetical protein BCR36DRAFT_412750 [Piromyces finnis]|eukprot:ORX49230.1 hypothetical protein BCR36DRAFT_412750 [Piromyces finnis]
MLNGDKSKSSLKSNKNNEKGKKSDNTEESFEDLGINLDLDLNDAIYELGLKKSAPRVRFHDSYTMPNATISSGIDFEDNYDVSGIYKSTEYYNQMINGQRFGRRDSERTSDYHSRNHRYYHASQPSSFHQNSMMDYISKSQPLNGGSNLLAQFLKLHNDQEQSNSSSGKGKEPHINNEMDNSSWNHSTSNSQPIPIQDVTSSSPLKPPHSMSSLGKSFDPNLYTIPSYKNKRYSRSHSHSHHHQQLSKSFTYHQDMQFPKSFSSITKTQEPLSMEDENMTDNENEPLMIKTSSYQQSNAIDINGNPSKKSIKAKHRNSRPPPPSPTSSYFGSYSSKVSGTFGSPISSSILVKTSQYIPDASLPYLVKTIDDHLVKNEDAENNDDSEEEYNIYNLKGGDYARDIFKFQNKLKRNILSKRSKSEPNLYELNKKKENDFNISEISIPGGFRREFMSSNAKKQGKSPPHWITGNFIDFLALYGHYAGDDDFDEDYSSDDYESDSWYDDDGNSIMTDDYRQHQRFESDIFNNEKIKISETRSSYELIPDNDKSKISIDIEPLNEKTPLLTNSSQSSLNNNYHKRKSKKQRKNNSSSQTGTASEGKTLFLLLKAFIGTGILFLPRAFSNGGILFSLVLLALSGWLTYFTMVLLIRCSEKFGGSYGDIGKQLFGRPFKIMIQGSIALTQSGFCCAYIIFILQSIKSIIETVSNGSVIIPDWAIIAAQILIYIPLSWIRKIQNFSITSLIADVFILIGLLYIICSDLFIISSEGPSKNFTFFNSDKFPLFLGTAVYAFEGIGLIIPLQRSMREPEKFPKVLKKSMLIIFASMFMVGGLSYYIFGDDVHTIIFMDVYPNSAIGTIVRALYTLAIIFSFPLTCYSGIHIIEPLFVPRKGPFRSFHLKSKKNMSMNNYASITSNDKEMNNASSTHVLPDEEEKKGASTSLTQNSSYSSLPNRRKKRETGKNSNTIKWMKNIFRAVFVSSLGVISYCGASNLDNFVSIIGSFACIPLMFIYPALLHYRGVAETSKERLTDILIIIIGTIATVWITKLSLDEWK